MLQLSLKSGHGSVDNSLRRPPPLPGSCKAALVDDRQEGFSCNSVGTRTPGIASTTYLYIGAAMGIDPVCTLR